MRNVDLRLINALCNNNPRAKCSPISFRRASATRERYVQIVSEVIHEGIVRGLHEAAHTRRSEKERRLQPRAVKQHPCGVTPRSQSLPSFQGSATHSRRRGYGLFILNIAHRIVTRLMAICQINAIHPGCTECHVQYLPTTVYLPEVPSLNGQPIWNRIYSQAPLHQNASRAPRSHQYGRAWLAAAIVFADLLFCLSLLEVPRQVIWVLKGVVLMHGCGSSSKQRFSPVAVGETV